MRIGLALISILAAGAAAWPAAGQVRGDPAAVAAAERLLAEAGGRDAWSSRTFYAEERAYLMSGEVAELRIWRDFATLSRRIENVTPSRRIVEWTTPKGGWVSRDGQVRRLDPVELAGEVQGLRQEPYAIYHRLARRDPALRAELRNDGARLVVFDAEERVLCWFDLDRRGALAGWGNHWQGNLNQHFYGPTADMGDANLPRFGVNNTGTFRFEYRLARLSPQPPPAPEHPAE